MTDWPDNAGGRGSAMAMARLLMQHPAQIVAPEYEPLVPSAQIVPALVMVKRQTNKYEPKNPWNNNA